MRFRGAESDRYDLVAIGGGTASLVASLGVAGLGGRAVIVEADRVGGDCLWTGCVPSKALLATASVAQLMRTADRFGLEPAEPRVELSRVLASVREAQAVIEPHDSPEMLSDKGVEVIGGRGRFAGPGRVQVGDRVLRYRAALVATGARPAVPPIDGLSDVAPLTSSSIWDLTRLPARLAVIGGGPVGCELGQAFSRLGTKVTIVETLPSLLPGEASDVGETLAECLRGEGIDVRAGVTATAASRSDGVVTLRLDDGSKMDFDEVLVATGRVPATDDLGLDGVGVEIDSRGHVIVDELMRTTGDRIFAAGDVTGTMPFAHVAAHQARIVVTNAMLRTRRSMSYDTIPWVTYTDPEVARVGLDAATARGRWGDRAVVQRFSLTDLDRAVTERSPNGWVELVGDPKRYLVGATIVGKGAGESIAEIVAFLGAGRRIDHLSTTVHAYPTLTEGASRAADEVLRARYFDPRLTRVTRHLLKALRRLDRPRG